MPNSNRSINTHTTYISTKNEACLQELAIINLIAMTAYLSLSAWLHLSLMAMVAMGATAEKLSPDFYDKVCPKALPTIKTVVQQAIAREPRIGASLLRLHFHDCFVNGCDASVLLDDTPDFTGEKTAGPNKKSARGFELVDQIKAAVNSACNGNVVSCADILAVAARDSVVASGGQSYKVLLGRRDSTTASKAAANKNIPSPFVDFSRLLSNFQSHGLTLEDLVVLSGAHTIGVARCKSFRSRIHNDTNIDSEFAASLHQSCPVTEGDDSISSLDGSPARFDTGYFNNLLQKKGLLHSDQELYKGDGGASDGLVKFYSSSSEGFWIDFGVSMIKMGNLSPLTGSQGEIRMDCRKVN